jgi:hypothetical protein
VTVDQLDIRFAKVLKMAATRASAPSLDLLTCSALSTVLTESRAMERDRDRLARADVHPHGALRKIGVRVRFSQQGRLRRVR